MAWTSNAGFSVRAETIRAVNILYYTALYYSTLKRKTIVGCISVEGRGVIIARAGRGFPLHPLPLTHGQRMLQYLRALTATPPPLTAR